MCLRQFCPCQDGRGGRTCPPAMSTTFAAGTTDGPSHVDEFGQKLWMKCVKCLENHKKTIGKWWFNAGLMVF